MVRLWSEPQAVEAIDRAQAVARLLGIPFHLLDLQEPFRRLVVDHFVAEYAAARTPNPCVPCNRQVRFGLLRQWARERGGAFIATGHYARVLQVRGQYQLWRGRDLQKDQSYVLHALTQEQLADARFPLGELTKDEVRTMARECGLPAADLPESQDVCFVAGGDYRRFLARYAPQAFQPGPILDLEGRRLGQHAGLVNYTVGQRKGIGLSASRPLYVLALDRERNALIVGPGEALSQVECVVDPMHHISGEVPAAPFQASAKIRYRHREVMATATPLAGRRLHVRFAHPQRGVTPGQYLVLYDGDQVLGGGPICVL